MDQNQEIIKNALSAIYVEIDQFTMDVYCLVKTKDGPFHFLNVISTNKILCALMI